MDKFLKLTKHIKVNAGMAAHRQRHHSQSEQIADGEAESHGLALGKVLRTPSDETAARLKAA